MSLQQSIADREFDLLPPGEKRVRLTVRFGPIYQANESYRCPVRFEGWGDQPPDIFGVDSLQAFAGGHLHEFRFKKFHQSRGTCVVPRY